MPEITKCPVCNGNGLVSAGFYSHPGDCHFWSGTGVNPEVCRSCEGKGWIAIREVAVQAPQWTEEDSRALAFHGEDD